MATPALPAPLTTTRQSSFFLPVYFQGVDDTCQYDDGGSVLIIVETGMFNRFFKRSSISKQRGAEMSSRLIPPNAGAMRTTVSMISSVSCVSRQIGNALMPPNLFKQNGFSFHNRHSC